MRYAEDTVEATRAGEAYHWPAGHTAWTEEGVVFLAVTPAAQEREMEEQITGS